MPAKDLLADKIAVLKDAIATRFGPQEWTGVRLRAVLSLVNRPLENRRRQRLRTRVLPDGSIVALVEIRSVRTEKHFLSGRYYVQIEFKNGRIRNAVGRTSHRDAETVRQELIDAIQLAYDEVNPFDYGYQEGRTDGHTEGRVSGLEEGKTEGYQQGYSDGRSEGFNQGHSGGYDSGLWQGRDQGSADERARVLGQITDMREALVREQRWGELVEPARRRYLGHAVRALTDVIQVLTPEPPRSDSEGESHDWLVNESESQEARFGEPQKLELRRDLLEKAMTHLNDRERHILTERRLRNNPTSLEDLSQQHGISRERVRQIEVRAFEKLQKAIKAAVVEQRLFHSRM